MKRLMSLVLVLGVLSLTAPVTAEAQVVSDLQVMIRNLQAQIAELQAQKLPVEPKVLTFSWTAKNATSCRVGNSKLPASGSKDIAITDKTVSFNVTCNDTDDLTQKTLTDVNVQITGVRNSQTNKIDKATLAWSSKNMPVCTAFIPNGKTYVSSSGSITASISSLTTDYVLTCPGPDNFKTYRPLQINLKVSEPASVTTKKVPVTVLTPNGGESYRPGDKVTVQWKTVGLPYNVPTQVDLSDDRIPGWTPSSLFGYVPALDHAKLVSSKGDEYVYEFSFTAPTTFNDGLPAKYQNVFGGDHYTILVYVEGGKDVSDKTFSIGTTNSKDLTFRVEDIVKGKGKKATVGKIVTLDYEGTFTNGNLFDSSYDRGTPFRFPVGTKDTIAGFSRGVEGMRVGGKRRIVIPPELGYGKEGVPGTIPPNTTIVFEVELLKVE